jgi:predicted anti-sigma-YlaC factor YlaD
MTDSEVSSSRSGHLPMLFFYVLLLGALALFTAYTRNFQRTLVELGSRVDDSAAALLMPYGQRLGTMALLAGWPVAIGLGMLFVAWWKAVALGVGAFLILVPLLGAFTPRPGSQHYVVRLRGDLLRRIGEGGRDVEELRRILGRLDEIAGNPPT